MIIRTVSDLHFEFQKDHGASLSQEICEGDFDVLVVAGDICSSEGLYEAYATLSKAAGTRQIVGVLGNHEYYHSDLNNTFKTVSKIQEDFTNVSILENNVKEINGQRFIGCTLWFYHSGQPSRLDTYMSDFDTIKGIYKWINNTCVTSYLYLENNIKPGDIVITHYLPHQKSIHPKYADSPINKYFYRRAEDLVEKLNANLWVHGHTHCSCDYTVNSTRVICNPFGYAIASRDEPNPDFIPNKDIIL